MNQYQKVVPVPRFASWPQRWPKHFTPPANPRLVIATRPKKATASR